MPTKKKSQCERAKPSLAVATARRPEKSKVSQLQPVPSKHSSVDERNLHNRMSKILVRSMPFYHGVLPGAECEQLLQAEGDYLVRSTRDEKKGKDQFVVSVMHDEQIRHIPIVKKDGGTWHINEVGKKTIGELINYLEVNENVLPSGAILKKKIKRPSYYIMHENVTMTDKIGEGNFGEVYKGMMREEGNTEKPCAIKMCKGDVTKREIIEFLKEAHVGRHLNHRNIVGFYGVAVQEMPVLLVIELAEGGSLQGYCHKHPQVAIEQLISWATDGSRGMTYLHKQNVLHRDLAARNCLLGKELELKIADFGKSEMDRGEIKMEKMKKIPIKWCAPEMLSAGKYTKKSDVWSYAMMMWEIFHRCTLEPFPNLTNMQAKDKIVSQEPIPLQPPPDCPQTGCKVLYWCWNKNPDERPEFEEILKVFAPNEEPPQGRNAYETY
ncbi:unnamed protein product, partial [Mesorhabditis spiculigera]